MAGITPLSLSSHSLALLLAEPATINTCVIAVCSAYRDGIQLIKHIRARTNGIEAPQYGPNDEAALKELDASLLRGEGVLRSLYERTFVRFGDAFARGDRKSRYPKSSAQIAYLTSEVARDALKDIVIHLQQQVVSNLKLHWQQHTYIDFTALQDVSDSSQDRCTLVLMQLQQRIITSGPVENLTPPPLNPANALARAHPTAPSLSYPEDTVDDSLANEVDLSVEIPALHSGHSMPSFNEPLTPPTSPFPTQRPLHRADSQTSTVHSKSSSIRPTGNPYSPIATTVTKPGFFGFSKRTAVEPVVRMPENPLVDEYLATAMEDDYSVLSRANSVSTTRRSLRSPRTECQQSNGELLAEHDSPNSYLPLKVAGRGHRSFDTIHRPSIGPVTNMEILTSHRSISAINPKDLLPSETNKYQGFCKGAWKLSIGDKKRALEERTRPGGMYNAARYWQCKHCKFEGRLVQLDKKTNGYDMRVFMLAEGIRFRWEFLFKSHMTCKEAFQDPTRGKFGCIFCCAEGKGNPVFDGAQVFMGHLLEHRDRLPTGEALYRMNCLVGRQAAVDEDFDINIISKEGSAF